MRFAVVLTRPVGIVVPDDAVTHVGSLATKLMLIPGAGAAAGTPLLTKSIVMDVPKLAFNDVEVWVMSSDAVVAAFVTPSTYAGFDTVIVAGPGRTPLSVAFTVWPPAAIVTGDDATLTRPGALLTTVKDTPPP